ncbi:hypothetical protein JCM19046_1570 [Bacillus sp. JCM 19046]|nr:hypothetical protein JCM19046_1570 [Bacillus sp. JCM 19046]
MLNAIPSLILALFVSTFFASGGIAENYTDSYFVAPFFFIILLVWLIGLILGLVTKNVLLSVPLMYLSIVIGFVISSLIYN